MKKISILIIIFAVMLLVAGCGNQQQEGNNRNGGSSQHGAADNQSGHIGSVADYENYIYAAESISFDHDMLYLSGMLAHGERIYYWGRNQEWVFEVASINADGGGRQREGIRAGHIINLSITEDGNIALLEERQERTEQGYWLRNFYYAEFASDGTELLRHDLGDITPQGPDWFSITGAAFADGGNIAITAEWPRLRAAVHLFNVESEAAAVLNLNIPHSLERGIITLQDGRVVVLDMESGEAVLREIDFDLQGWGESFRLPEGSPATLRLFCAGEGSQFDLLMSNQNHLYGYSIDTGEKTALISWIESGLIYLPNEHVAQLADGRFVLLSGYWHEGQWEGGLTLFSPVPRTELPERTVITLGGLDISRAMRRAVLEFNRQSQTHIIRVNDYSGGDWQAVEAGLMRLQIEMMTGTGPDILYAGELGSIFPIAARGMLLDLYPFIDADPSIERTDFFPSVLSALENADGTLPLISNRFTVETVIGTQETLGHIESWTPADMLEFIEARADSPYIFTEWVDSENFLRNMILFAGPDLIDWDTFTANFNSESFIQILEVAALLPLASPSVMTSWSIEELYKGTMLFDITWLSSTERFQDYADLLGDIVPIGMPTADGSGAHIISTRAEMGINAATEHADVAWEFLRGVLLPVPTLAIEYGFPLRIDLYDALIAEAMEVRMMIDEDGNLVRAPRSQFSWLADEDGHGGVEVSLYEMSEDTAAQLRGIVESARPRGRFSPEIMAFIMGDFATFAAGGRSAEDTARIIQNRVQIWLSEQELVFG